MPIYVQKKCSFACKSLKSLWTYVAPWPPVITCPQNPNQAPSLDPNNHVTQSFLAENFPYIHPIWFAASSLNVHCLAGFVSRLLIFVQQVLIIMFLVDDLDSNSRVSILKSFYSLFEALSHLEKVAPSLFPEVCVFIWFFKLDSFSHNVCLDKSFS